MDIQLCDKHLMYSVAICEHSILLSKILKYVDMNISYITAEYLDIKSYYVRCFSLS